MISNIKDQTYRQTQLSTGIQISYAEFFVDSDFRDSNFIRDSKNTIAAATAMRPSRLRSCCDGRVQSH